MIKVPCSYCDKGEIILVNGGFACSHCNADVKLEINIKKIEDQDKFNFDGFLYASLMKIRKQERIDHIPIDSLMDNLNKFRAENPSIFVPDISWDGVKEIIDKSKKMFLICRGQRYFVRYKINFRIEEDVN